MALKIEIYSDVICPWCFLGKHRLERALDSLGKRLEAEIHYLPYMLDPTIPPEGVDRKKRLEAKYGSSISAMDLRLQTLGKEENIEFNFGQIHRTPNTFDAHRVLWLAGKEGVENPVSEALFKAYFTEGKDLADKKVLADAAVSGGLARAKVEKLLNGQEGVEEIQELIEKAYDLGISGVPHFVIGGQFHLSGAQPVETFVTVLEEAFKSSEGPMVQKLR